MYFVNFSRKEEVESLILIMYRKLTMPSDITEYDFPSLKKFHDECINLTPGETLKLRISPKPPTDGWISYIIAIRLTDDNYIIITISDPRSYKEVADRIMKTLKGEE